MMATLRKPMAWISWLSMATLMAACVTVNIYFPAPEMSEAAENIVKEVWSDAQEQKQPESDPAPGPQSGVKPASQPDLSSATTTPSPQVILANGVGRMVTALFDLVSDSAQAQGMDINVSTASIRSVKNSIRTRFGQLTPHFNSGALGIASNGDLVLRNAGSLDMRSRAGLQRLVQAENQDRARLYSEIASANGHPEWTGQIREIFAEKWRQRARSGWQIETAPGRWTRR
ncbi:MAG: YdbL family protein [Magnetococcales bacterium]|nr:YdbL family protein [Magnetococcales bacterium]